MFGQDSRLEFTGDLLQNFFLYYFNFRDNVNVVHEYKYYMNTHTSQYIDSMCRVPLH